MIKPHKYLDINLCLLSIGGELLNILVREKIIRISELQNRLIHKKGDKSKELFLPAITLLYALGKIEYHKEIDSIEYI